MTRLTDAAILVERQAKLMMKEPKTGRLYRIYSKGRKKVRGGRLKAGIRRLHRASAPGEPPAVLTGTLWKSITHEGAKKQLKKGYFVSRVGSNIKYSFYLELGTINIKKRPWLKPALERAAPDIRKLFEKPIK